MSKKVKPVKVIKLDLDSVKVKVELFQAKDKFQGTIETNLKTHAFARPEDDEDPETIDDQTEAAYDAASDTLESFILSLACAGVDIETPAFKEALETTIEAVANNLD